MSARRVLKHYSVPSYGEILIAFLNIKPKIDPATMNADLAFFRAILRRIPNDLSSTDRPRVRASVSASKKRFSVLFFARLRLDPAGWRVDDPRIGRRCPTSDDGREALSPSSRSPRFVDPAPIPRLACGAGRCRASRRAGANFSAKS
jgi:hypothetical protein